MAITKYRIINTPKGILSITGADLYKVVEETAVPSLQAVTDVGNTTTLNIAALSFNDLALFAQTGVDVDNIGIGNNALSTNTGTDSIGIGTNALNNNSGIQVTGIGSNVLASNSANQITAVGYGAGQSNTGIQSVFFGGNSGQFNTGSSNSFFGYGSGTNNTGVNVTAVGHSACASNEGTSIVSIGFNSAQKNIGSELSTLGAESSFLNTGINVTAIGRSSAYNNEGDNNTSLGYQANFDFKDDVANLKNVADATTDIDTGLNRITITAHGFGSIGVKILLKYTTTGTPISGLTNGNVELWEVIDANTIENVNGIFSIGTDVHTFTPQFVYDNVTVLGANAEPTASNQVTLGDAAVTEVASGNYIFNVGQTLGAGQDNHVLTYDNGTGKISLEAAAAGGGGAFEIIDEGNGNGIIRAGRTAANYGNVGLDAADLSINTAVSTTVGATGTRATAIGFQSTASGINAIAMGQLSVADGNDSFTMGVQANASGLYSVAIGRLAIASAQSGVAIGYNTNNAATQSVAIGSSNVMLAPATGSTSVGAGNTTRQTGQHIFGNGNDSGTGGSNIIFGANNNISSNTIGMAIGRNNTTDGNEAITIGRNLTTHSYREVAYGVANTAYTATSEIAWDVNDRLVVIGAGQPGTTTKDAFTVLKGGAIGINIDNFEASVQSDVDVEVGGTFVAHKAVKNDTTTTYAFVLTDKDKVVTFDNAGAVAATIPANASVAYPIGTQITLINKGAGTVTVGITTDTLNQNVGALTLAQYDKRTLTKIAATEWILGY